MGEWLADSGFEVVASGAVDLGLLGEELFARGADRDARSMGYWSLTRSSLYMLAIKSEEAIAAATNKRRAQGIASPTVLGRPTVSRHVGDQSPRVPRSLRCPA